MLQVGAKTPQASSLSGERTNVLTPQPHHGRESSRAMNDGSHLCQPWDSCGRVAAPLKLLHASMLNWESCETAFYTLWVCGAAAGGGDAAAGGSSEGLGHTW